MEHLILILARRGHGKTTLAGRLAKNWPPDRCLVHDPLDQFPDLPLVAESWQPETAPSGLLVIADELDLVAPASGYDAAWVRYLVHYGRHAGISMIGCSRRPANIHRDFSALASEVYLGKITEPRDLDYICKAWGEECQACATLPPYQFLRIQP